MNAPIKSLTDVGHVDDIPARGARVVKLAETEIGVFRTLDDRIFAIENRCPHRGGPLSEGIVHGHFVTCPLHNWVISLETGEAQGADEGCVRTIPVEVGEGDRLLLDLAALLARKDAA
ncbi:Assimilatory nitrite reductase [NAD(P)H] small subunit [Hartmannibacter diazotrophicus]|uniref:Assimilatory nitrite reductase [NAD(P)H] small subunit n=1 Tax=Hartmannibacter diazotrophicus TaxID=1482074 RepID=A0A2C9D6U4_9HYPH|nr:nitrite reductase small subunit NirD [Hartmannibacter diazotrophicus]SON55910.1 Assimilatory nitrite reductase [NAD(P)H] small subunit [Hartmannibacter diazotrophicus]